MSKHVLTVIISEITKVSKFTDLSTENTKLVLLINIQRQFFQLLYQRSLESVMMEMSQNTIVIFIMGILACSKRIQHINISLFRLLIMLIFM